MARTPPRTPLRILLVAAGLVCMGLAVLGALLPGLPTTIFLLGASACFLRSAPSLEARLVRHPLFRPYRPFVDGTRPIPVRARVVAAACLWTAVGLSLWTFAARDALHGWVLGTMLVAGAIGTYAIVRFRRPTPAATPEPGGPA